MNRLRSLKEQAKNTSFWMNRMQDILDKERANGMTSFHLDVDPSASNWQIAKDFCLMYESVKWETTT
jgi:hypothetical protein